MEVLVIGAGGREHALAWRLARDEDVARVRVAPGNGGTAAVAASVPEIDIFDPAAVARHAARERYDLVVIGPEGPLAAGVADELATARVPVFGPSRAAARLESSKAFAKQFMARHHIPTARFEVFDELAAAQRHVRALAGPCVVKADGLAAGKGVAVCDGPEDALAALDEMMAARRFGAAGARVVIEERLLDILQPDVMWVGGLTELLRIAAHASAYDQLIVPHGSGPYSYHFIASQTAPAFCEYVAASPDGRSIQPVFGELFEGEALPTDGKIRLGERPGFGMELRSRADLVPVD